MTAIEIACALARRFEGIADGDRLRPGLQPYRDPIGYWTIGYGHLVTRDRAAPMPDMTWTMDDAEAGLRSDITAFAAAVRRLLRAPVGGDGLRAGQFAALADFAFNVGLGNLRASTLLRLVNRGEIEAAAGEFPKWRFAGGIVLPGLIRRRAAEVELWLSGM